MQGIQADLDTVTRLGLASTTRPALAMWKPSDLAKCDPPPEMRLVGDNEILKGYEGLVLIAGPGNSGKSLAGSTLALAGARGDGHWMGRKVHRQFKTMIIQAENGSIRLKEEFKKLQELHPEIDLESHVLISSPPEGGLPFHKPQFRAAVREEALKFKPDVALLDTWAQIAADDAAKDVVEKIGEIRSCFAGGEDFPGIVILAHTKKPRAEEMRKGRALINQISGSIALGNTARCVYMLLPWCDDIEDDRIYWACVKLNNGEMYSPSVWHRRFGTFFVHDDKTNPKDFGRAEDDAREKISADHLRVCFDKTVEHRPTDLVKLLRKVSGAAENTCYRAIGGDGYLRPLLMRNGGGKLKLKEPNE